MKLRRPDTLERTLPLLMMAVFAVGLAALLGATYVTLADRAHVIVRDRLAHAVMVEARSLASGDVSTLAARLAADAPSVRDMTREDVETSLRRADAPGPRDTAAIGFTLAHGDGARSVAAEARVGDTPWYVVLEVPELAIAQRPRSTLVELLPLCALLVVAGAVMSWLVSRRITRPLVELTSAVDAMTRALPHGGAAATSPTGNEITRLSRAFDVMSARVDATQRELARRVAEAEAARAEAERANRAKNEFLAMMSHELRTPLTAIGGYVNLIALGIHGTVTDAQRQALERIGRNQTHLLTLIDDVLSFAKIDAGRLRYDVVDAPLDDVLAGLDALVSPQMRTRGLTFDVELVAAPLVVRADRAKVRQVVLNLLANAAKYTPDGGCVVLFCDADDAQVRVHVRDTGIGIPAERLETMFSPRVPGARAPNRSSDGTGLGLATSRELARGMGGELTVVSDVGRGSTFTLAIPRAPGVPGGPLAGASTATPAATRA